MSDLDHPSTIATVEPSYPALTGLARHGTAVASLAGAVAFAATAWVGYDALGAGALAIALIVAAMLYGVARLLSDIARLLVDTLIPK